MKPLVVVDREIYFAILKLSAEIEPTDQTPVVAALIKEIGALETARQSNSLSLEERAKLEWLFKENEMGSLVGNDDDGYFREEHRSETSKRQKTGTPLPANRKILYRYEKGWDVVVEDRQPIAPDVLASLVERKFVFRLGLWALEKFKKYFVDIGHHFYKGQWKALVTSDVPRDGSWIVDAKNDPIGWTRNSIDARFIAEAVNLMFDLTWKFGSFAPLDIQQNGISEIFRGFRSLLNLLGDSYNPQARRYHDFKLSRALNEAIRAVEEFESVHQSWREASTEDKKAGMGYVKIELRQS